VRVPLLLGVATFTSLLAIVAIRRRGLGTAVAVLLEVVGATVVLFFANVAAGGTLVLLARKIWFYTTLYDVADISLLVISLLQAVTLTAWLRLR
jgi:hypothetical protein